MILFDSAMKSCWSINDSDRLCTGVLKQAALDGWSSEGLGIDTESQGIGLASWDILRPSVRVTQYMKHEGLVKYLTCSPLVPQSFDGEL